jgi:TIR domain
MEIFVSYAREDAARVGPLAAGLEAHGYRVFWDRKIPSGKSWHEVLEEALGRADRVIVVWSKYSIKSGFVRDEAARAQLREALVPILLDDVPPPLGFGHIQAANLIDWSGDTSAESFRSLLSDLGAPAVPPVQHLSPLPMVSATTPPQPSARGRTWLPVAVAVSLALGTTAYFSFTRKPPEPRPRLNAAVSTAAVSLPSLKPAPAPEPPSPPSPRKEALELLHGYYHAINQGELEARRFFSERPSHYYLWVSKPNDAITLDEIDKWIKGHAVRTKMDDATFEQSPSGTFSYVETQYVPQKDGREKAYTALLAVDIEQHKIKRLQTVAKRPP